MAKLGGAVVLAIPILFFVMMASAPPYANGAISCGAIFRDLQVCRPFLTKGYARKVNACCGKLKTLNSNIKSKTDRLTACNCVKDAANVVKASPKWANMLPKKCGVKINFPISYNVDCNKIS